MNFIHNCHVTNRLQRVFPTAGHATRNLQAYSRVVRSFCTFQPHLTIHIQKAREKHNDQVQSKVAGRRTNEEEMHACTLLKLQHTRVSRFLTKEARLKMTGNVRIT
jgi:hypothetical protein